MLKYFHKCTNLYVLSIAFLSLMAQPLWGKRPKQSTWRKVHEMLQCRWNVIPHVTCSGNLITIWKRLWISGYSKGSNTVKHTAAGGSEDFPAGCETVNQSEFQNKTQNDQRLEAVLQPARKWSQLITVEVCQSVINHFYRLMYKQKVTFSQWYETCMLVFSTALRMCCHLLIRPLTKRIYKPELKNESVINMLFP